MQDKPIPLKTTQDNRVDLLLTLILTLMLALMLTLMQPKPKPKLTSKPYPKAQYKDKERCIEEGGWDQGTS
jgi:hypothetical protein